MASNVFSLAVGIALGLLIAYILATPPPIEPASLDHNPLSTETSTKSEKQRNSDELPGSEATPAESRGTDEIVANDSDPAFIPARTPPEYDEIIGPMGPRRSVRDMHATFKAEPRLEPWASAMETGIEQVVSEFAPGAGLTVDYIECRTTICELGGFLSSNEENRAPEMWTKIIRSGWWQGNDAFTITVGESGGLDRFVLVSFDNNL